MTTGRINQVSIVRIIPAITAKTTPAPPVDAWYLSFPDASDSALYARTKPFDLVFNHKGY
jgi:hypothetical protein